MLVLNDIYVYGAQDILESDVMWDTEHSKKGRAPEVPQAGKGYRTPLIGTAADYTP